MRYASFDEIRPRLEKQYENAEYSMDDAWDEQRMRGEWSAWKAANPNEHRGMQRAMLTRMLLEHAPVAIEKWNPFPGKFKCYNLPMEDVNEHYRTAGELVPGVDTYGMDFQRGLGWMVDKSHAAADWKRVLELGIAGMLEQVAGRDTPFYRAVTISLEAVRGFCHRIARLNDNPVYDEIAEHAPRTLHEAFALAFVIHDVIEICQCEQMRTMGRFDSLYIDFYRNDLAAGRLTRESAKELVKFFWIVFYARFQGLRFGKNFCFGPKFNELSYLALEAYYEMNIQDPKLSILVKEDMPQDFAELYVKCIRDGRTAIVSLNYDVIVEGLVKDGRTREDAENFVPIGCYEPAVAGKEMSCSGATHLFLPVILLALLEEGRQYASFEELKDDYLRKIGDTIKLMQEKQIPCDKVWSYINPVPLLSATFASCVERGLDVSEAGAVYNSTGTVVSYTADAVDSLTAIRYLVFEEKLCTLDELRAIIADNWQGHERLRRIALTKPPKWGNNDQRADALAVEIADFTSKRLKETANGRGGHFFPSIYGQKVVENGREIAALPSGRLAGEPMSKNMDAVIGMDRHGITALMESVLKIDMTAFPCGTCLDLMLHPTSVKGREGIPILVSIIRRFIAQGGSGIQFNIFDADVLKDAQRHPEKYENLQVRVCGWNVRFNDLEPAAQDTFIRQAEELVG